MDFTYVEFIFPFVFFIGIPLIVLLCAVRVSRKNKYSKGKRIANTELVRNTPQYKAILMKYKVRSVVLKALCILCMGLSLMMLARPSKTEWVSTPVYNRDIFLCMDVSASLDDVNKQLIVRMEELVKSLKGERFGISIFNTNSILLVPLTDDYDYILEVLQGVSASIGYDATLTGGVTPAYKMVKAVTVGHQERGSSLIGDGLASCVFDFPELDEERTRVIIFTTDNQLEGEPVVGLQEAAEMARSKKIKVFGVAPAHLGKEYEREKTDLKRAIETTGGVLYVDDATTNMSEIVKSIEQMQLNKGEEIRETKRTDTPQGPFLLLLGALILLFSLSKRVGL